MAEAPTAHDALGEDALDMVHSGDMAMAAYAPGVLEGSFENVQATDLASAEAVERHNNTAMAIASFHQQMAAAPSASAALVDGSNPAAQALLVAQQVAAAQGVGVAVPPHPEMLHTMVAASMPVKEAAVAAAKAALASVALAPMALPQDEAHKAAQREAARAAARERKRKSRMNPVVREREKARDRMYKMKARQALKGEALEAYRKKDRERKRLKRLEKAKQDSDASATGLASGSAAAELVQPEPVQVVVDAPSGDENGVPDLETTPEMNTALANVAAGHVAAALEQVKRNETLHGASTVAATEI